MPHPEPVAAARKRLRLLQAGPDWNVACWFTLHCFCQEGRHSANSTNNTKGIWMEWIVIVRMGAMARQVSLVELHAPRLLEPRLRRFL